jgi:hypothetical protein
MIKYIRPYDFEKGTRDGEVVDKINEIIGVLSSSKFIEALKKENDNQYKILHPDQQEDKYLCYTCNQWIKSEDEHKCTQPEQQGECSECLLRNHALGRDTFPNKQKEVDPPEQEERLYKQADTDTDIIKFIEVTEEYISKEKIKTEIGQYQCWAQRHGEDPYKIPSKVILEGLDL